MAQGFNLEYRSQQEWGWLLSTWLFLSGTGSGLFLLFEFYHLPREIAWWSLGAIVLGGLVLLWELGSPLRAWRGVSRLGSSWLSRGALSVGLLVVCGVMFLAPGVVPGLPWAQGGAFSRALEWIAALCALMISLYPGFFLAKNRSIPFWNTALLPVISFGFALMGASALALLVGVGGVQFLAGVLLLLNLVLLAGHLWAMGRAGGAAQESVRLLNCAPLSGIFRIGVVLVGLVLPGVLLLWFPSLRGLAAAGMLLGTLLFRYCVLKAGVYVPATLVPQGMDLSRLKPTSADLQREYAAMAAQSSTGRG